MVRAGKRDYGFLWGMASANPSKLIFDVWREGLVLERGKYDAQCIGFRDRVYMFIFSIDGEDIGSVLTSERNLASMNGFFKTVQL